MDLPPEVPMTMVQLDYCVNQAVRRYPDVLPIMVKTLISVEGGQIGTIRRNKDASYDLGPMQINTIHTKAVKKNFGFSQRDLIFDACKNILVGTWLLSGHLDKSNNKVWLAMGNYHSKTPGIRRNYLMKVAESYLNLVASIRSGKEAEGIGRTVNWGRTSNKNTVVPSLSELESLIGESPLPRHTSGSPLIASPADQTKPKKKVMSINNRENKLRFID